MNEAILKLKIDKKSEDHEKYHLEGMTKEQGSFIETKIAAMYCGNSFVDGGRFVLKQFDSTVKDMKIYTVLEGCDSEGGFHGKQLFKLKTDAYMEMNTKVNKRIAQGCEYIQVSEDEWREETDYIKVVEYELI